MPLSTKYLNAQPDTLPLQKIFSVRRIFTLLFLFPVAIQAQPSGYYNTAFGKNKDTLREALHQIIKNHTVVSYASLWTHYAQTDIRPNGKVWDMYSDKPGQTPPYEYTFGSDQCGNYKKEGDCYNREHSFPQSYFNGSGPMYSDLFHVYPTDGYVNGKRADFMYGVVSNPSFTSMNGSKVGNNTYPGSPSGSAFEPIDDYKGDFARTYFYIATRYKGEDAGWSSWEMSDGAELKQWAINMLLEWHQNDPVSQKELDRNNAVYNIQNNRNPFIDYPVFADCIWGNADCSTLTVAGSPKVRYINIYPNPATDRVHIHWQSPEETLAVDVFNTNGQQMHSEVLQHKVDWTLPVDTWPKGIYFIHFRGKDTREVKKLVVQ